MTNEAIINTENKSILSNLFFIFHVSSYCLSILYPTPQTTFKYCGFLGLISIFLLNYAHGPLRFHY